MTTLTGLTTSGSRVYKSRVYPHGDAHVPGLTVYTLRDEVVDDSRTLGNREKRDLTLAVQARSKPPEGTELDDQLDAMCAETEAALMADPTLGNRVLHCEHQATEMDLEGDLERPVGIARMTFQVRYVIAADDPETLIYYGG